MSLGKYLGYLCPAGGTAFRNDIVYPVSLGTLEIMIGYLGVGIALDFFYLGEEIILKFAILVTNIDIYRWAG